MSAAATASPSTDRPMTTVFLCDSCGDTQIALVLDDDGQGMGIGPCPDCPHEACQPCRCAVTG